MPILASVLCSLHSASRAGKRVLFGVKNPGKTNQNPSSEKQKTSSSHPVLILRPAHIEKPVSFNQSEAKYASQNPDLVQDLNTSSPCAKRKTSTETAQAEASSLGSSLQSGQTSIFSIDYEDELEVLSPSSSIHKSSSFVDPAKSSPRSTKRFIRIQQPVRDSNQSGGFSVHQDYYYEYLPQFAEVKKYTACQSENLRSVFEDDSDDEDGDNNTVPQTKKWLLKKKISQRFMNLLE